MFSIFLHQFWNPLIPKKYRLGFKSRYIQFLSALWLTWFGVYFKVWLGCTHNCKFAFNWNESTMYIFSSLHLSFWLWILYKREKIEGAIIELISCQLAYLMTCCLNSFINGGSWRHKVLRHIFGEKIASAQNVLGLRLSLAANWNNDSYITIAATQSLLSTSRIPPTTKSTPETDRHTRHTTAGS